MDVNNEILKQFDAMGGIDQVVRNALGGGHLEGSMRESGLFLAARLAAWNESLPEVERHDMGWVVKKANDSINEFVNRTLRASMNEALGFKKDFYP